MMPHHQHCGWTEWRDGDANWLICFCLFMLFLLVCVLCVLGTRHRPLNGQTGIMTTTTTLHLCLCILNKTQQQNTHTFTPTFCINPAYTFWFCILHTNHTVREPTMTLAVHFSGCSVQCRSSFCAYNIFYVDAYWKGDCGSGERCERLTAHTGCDGMWAPRNNTQTDRFVWGRTIHIEILRHIRKYVLCINIYVHSTTCE